LVVLLFVCFPTVAQEGGEPNADIAAAAASTPASNFPASLPGIETVAVFPGIQDSRFVLGEFHTQVIGVKNNANEAINITHVHGALKSPFDFNYNIQNVSQRQIFCIYFFYIYFFFLGIRKKNYMGVVY
jgi:hypothetical protein